MKQQNETFIRGAPEVYFEKPYLNRQHVRARRRPGHLKTALAGDKITTARRQTVMSRLWRRWFFWFPFPIGDRT
jgi:hypothetical protein